MIRFHFAAIRNLLRSRLIYPLIGIDFIVYMIILFLVADLYFQFLSIACYFTSFISSLMMIVIALALLALGLVRLLPSASNRWVLCDLLALCSPYCNLLKKHIW